MLYSIKISKFENKKVTAFCSVYSFRRFHNNVLVKVCGRKGRFFLFRPGRCQFEFAYSLQIRSTRIVNSILSIMVISKQASFLSSPPLIISCLDVSQYFETLRTKQPATIRKQKKILESWDNPRKVLKMVGMQFLIFHMSKYWVDLPFAKIFMLSSIY